MRIGIAAAFLLLIAHGINAYGKTVLVFAPHPDDEAICCSGIIYSAKARGDTVKVVVVTNGDISGVNFGYTRETETIAAMTILGLSEQDVIFLGYGDASLMTLYQSTSDTTIYPSHIGLTSTYAGNGLGGTDYHFHLYGAHGSYNRQTLLGDIKSLLANFLPDDIYTTSYYDQHTDHQATFAFVLEALVSLTKQGSALETRLHETIIHPFPSNAYAPETPFPAPSTLSSIPLSWNSVESVPLPAIMRDDALKLQALGQYVSQGGGPYFAGFVKKNEIFWVRDIPDNVALTAAVTVSSENVATGQLGVRAVDGIVDGVPRDSHKEWTTVGQLAGAWIQLNWSAPVSISNVVLHDRLVASENILSGTVLFSDGTTLPVGALPLTGIGLTVPFAPKTISWLRFQIDSAIGTNAGLAEIEVFGRAAANTSNHLPIISVGPVSDLAQMIYGQVANLTVDALDVDSDPLQYTWSADAGTVVGTGSGAIYTPPIMSSDIYPAITVAVTDSRGGVVQNSTLVKVAGTTTSLAAVSLVPSAVIGGTTSLGTVTLSESAASGGASITLTSSNTSAATVLSSVTVPAGSTSASFTVATSTVSTSTMTTISASFAGTTRTASLTVFPIFLNPNNIAGSARVTVSSQNASTGQLGAKAVDGVVDGYPRDCTKEWATVGQLDGAWIQLDWSSGAIINQVVLHDRINLTENIRSGTLVFSDGTSIPVGTLPNDGMGLTVMFSSKFVQWVRFGVDNAVGISIGLAEIEVFSPAVSSILSAVTLNPTSVTGGSTSQGNVTLSGPAASGGASVMLASSNTSAATVPSSVTVPAGSRSASFTVTTYAVSASTAVVISAGYGGGSQTSSLTVTPATISFETLNPTSVTGGSTSQGNVTLSGPAASGGASVMLTSSNKSAATVPPSVTVPAGSTSASFTVRTYAVSASTTVVISAGYGGGGQTSSLTVTPATVSSVTLNPTSVTGGSTSPGKVTLSGPAASGGALVTLTSGNTSAATVPSSVMVPAGSRSAGFTVTTYAVSASTAVVILAGYGSGSQTSSLTVTPATVSSVTLNPTSVAGGSTSQGNVTLSGPAASGSASVMLTSSNTSAATVPSSVMVPAGSTSASFTVTTSKVSTSTMATISVSFAGTTKTASLTLSPVSLNPNNIAGSARVTVSSQNASTGQLGAKAVDGVVDGYPRDYTKEWATVGQLDGAWIQLDWSSGAIINQVVLHDRINLTENIRSGTLVFSDETSIPVGALPNDGTGLTVTFGAKSVQWIRFRGDSTVGISIGLAEIEVFSPAVSSILNAVTLNPASVTGGSTSQGNVTLSGPAASGGASVMLTSSNTLAATVPSSITVPAGSTSASFTVTTSTVSTSTMATISASFAGTTKTASLTLSPVSLNPNNIAGSARVTVSSQNASTGQLGAKAVDGVVDGYPRDYTKEWATVGQLDGAWIQLDWSSGAIINQVVLHDRINLTENIRSGTLVFSDGTSIPVGTLPNDGTGLTVTFGAKSVQWIRFRGDSAVGINIGLAEIEAWGTL